jgi:hypothetical protein
MELARTTVRALLAAAGGRQKGGLPVTIICSVEGGGACRVAQGEWDDPALATVTQLLIGNIGWKTIEHAPARHDDHPDTCCIDLGEGFAPLRVANESRHG